MNTDVRLAVLSSCRWDTEGQQQSESIDLHLLLQTEWLQRLHCWHRRKDKRTFPSDAGNSIQIWLAFIKWNYKKVKVEQSGEFNSTVNHDSTATHVFTWNNHWSNMLSYTPVIRGTIQSRPDWNDVIFIHFIWVSGPKTSIRKARDLNSDPLAVRYDH